MVRCAPRTIASEWLISMIKRNMSNGDVEKKHSMRNVVFCTFTKRHGINPGLVLHGFIDVDGFLDMPLAPGDCVHIDIYQRSIRYHYSDGTIEETELDYWGTSSSILRMCKDIGELSFPFECHCVVNSVFGEYE